MSDRDNTFDTLNDALMAQIAKLQSIDPKDKEQMELVTDQSKAVSHLAGNVIQNANAAMSAVRMYSELTEGADRASAVARAPKMLGGSF